MQYQNLNKFSEESGVYERKETSSSVHHEKLDSFWFVIFKYWKLLAALWILKNLISPASSDGDGDSDIGVGVEFSTFNNILHFINGYPVKIWDLINSVLIFEGLRKKSLEILLKVIVLMEAYMVVQMVITFFDMTSDAGLVIAKQIIQKRFPDTKPDKNLLSFFAVAIILVWCSYYYFMNLYGAKKARDILKGNQKDHKH